MSDYPVADADLVGRVQAAMTRHEGYENRIDRHELVIEVCGKFTETLDRKVRDALATETAAINSDGYYIPTEIDKPTAKALGALESYAISTWGRASRIRTHLRKQREPVKAEQMRLIGVSE